MQLDCGGAWSAMDTVLLCAADYSTWCLACLDPGSVVGLNLISQRVWHNTFVMLCAPA